MLEFEKRLKNTHSILKKLKAKFEIKMDKDEQEKYLNSILEKEAKRPRALYIHVPFCNKICSFCPFFTPPQLVKKEYHNYIIAEIDKIKDYPYMKRPFASVYFGGGTPTAISPSQMDQILTKIEDSFTLSKDCEISLETSITELTDEMLEVLLKHKVNRLSIGIQTFDNASRKILNRRGSGETALNRIKHYIKSGIDNCNMDLIYNYPWETMDQIRFDLARINEANVAGFSVYSLNIYEGTQLYRKSSEKDFEKLNDLEREYKFYQEIMRLGHEYGYKHIQNTKMVKDNRDGYKYVRTTHNFGDCVAIGYKAGGHIENYFYMNPLDPGLYFESGISKRGRVLDERYFIYDSFVDNFETGIIDLNHFSKLFNLDLEKILKPKLDEYIKKGLIEYQDSTIKILEKGLFWGNTMCDEVVDIILENDK